MKTLSSTEAKSTFNSVLAELVSSGEPVTITSHGKPVAVLQPVAPRNRTFGRLAGAVTLPGDFDAPMTEDEIGDWEGRE